MKVSAKAEYACLAMLALARHGPESPPLRIREISESLQHPRALPGADPLPAQERRAWWSSTRGASGGYHLARPASAITVGQVLNAVDGPDLATRVDASARCPEAALLDPVWESARAAQRAVLDNTTIEQLARQAAPLEWTI